MQEQNISRYRQKRVEEERKFVAEHGFTKKELKLQKRQATLVKELNDTRGDKYDYSFVEFKGMSIPVTILCKKHNKKFEQTPKSHLRGRGCPLCAKEQCGAYLKKTQEQFLIDAKRVCGDKYTFEHAKYVNNETPVNVTCLAHGIFPIRPNNLISGKGCPSCAPYGYSPHKEGALYVFKCDSWVKVGITNRTASVRVKDICKSSALNFTVLFERTFADGSIPLAVETAILRELRATYKQPTEIFDGSTECFYDVDHEWLLSRIEQLIKETQ